MTRSPRYEEWVEGVVCSDTCSACDGFTEEVRGIGVGKANNLVIVLWMNVVLFFLFVSVQPNKRKYKEILCKETAY